MVPLDQPVASLEMMRRWVSLGTFSDMCQDLDISERPSETRATSFSVTVAVLIAVLSFVLGILSVYLYKRCCLLRQAAPPRPPIPLSYREIE
jgi:hypothetical protein